MARGKSVIDVLIVGDVKNLVGAFNQADQSMGGLLKSAGKAFLGAKLVGEGFDFIQGALAESDRLGDALARLNGQIGEADTAKLDAISTGFADLGLSRQDVLELSANFADLATSIGLTDDQITTFAPGVATAAGALALLREEDPATLMDLIGKAAGGSAKAAKELGVTLDSNLTPAQQLDSILAQLAPTVDQVTGGSKDLEGQQKKLGAQWETLTGQVGQMVEGPLTDLLGFINDEIAALPHAIEGFQMLGNAIFNAFQEALSPLARVNDALGDLGDTLRGIPFLGDIIGGIFGGQLSQSNVAAAQRAFNERNGQGAP